MLDLDEHTCKQTVQAIEVAGGRALAVGVDVSDADQVSEEAGFVSGQVIYVAGGPQA